MENSDITRDDILRQARANSLTNTAPSASDEASLDEEGKDVVGTDEEDIGESMAPPVSPGSKGNPEMKKEEQEEKNTAAARTDSVATRGVDEGQQWMYLDGVTPNQHGPFSQPIMLKLLRTGTAHKDMMGWSQGMPDWQPLGQVQRALVP